VKGPSTGMNKTFDEFIRTQLMPDTLLVMCGLPATGKSTAAGEIARRRGFPIVATDAVRREILKDEDIFDPAVASNAERRQRVYDEVFRRAEQSLARSRGAILDGTFLTQRLRHRAAGIAASGGRRFVIMETRCSEKTALRRISERTRENTLSNALTAQAYFENKSRFEPVDPDALKRAYPGLKIRYVIVDAESDDPEDWRIVGDLTP